MSVAEIARRAGVGQGTVFRRFPTKEHLIAAIVRDRLESLVAVGTALLEAADAAGAVRDFLAAAARMQAQDVGFFQAVGAISLPADVLREGYDQLLDTADRLAARAGEHGALRADVSGTDLILLSGAICQAAAKFHEVIPGLWQRYLDLIFEGLRPQVAPHPAFPAPTRDQLRHAMLRGRVAEPRDGDG